MALPRDALAPPTPPATGKRVTAVPSDPSRLHEQGVEPGRPGGSAELGQRPDGISQPRHSAAAHWLVASAIVALAAALRLPNLATNPGWDGDEGYNLNIAWNLANGHHQMFALDFAFVQHPPLFFALAGVLFRLLGPGMLPLRLLSVAFCLGTTLLLPAVGRAMDGMGIALGPLTSPNIGQNRRERAMDGAASAFGPGARIGLLAALAYAVWPFAVVQSRFGYTYNGLAFWTVLTLFALLRYRRTNGRRALLLCGLATAAALATDQEALYLLPVLLLGLHRATVWRRIVALALALCGPACYLAALFLTDRPTLLFDLTHTAGRVSSGTPLFQLAAWLYSLADLLRIDPLIALGLTGLALIPNRAARRLTLGLLAAMLLVILKVRDPNPLFRTAEPLLPLACLGLGACAELARRAIAAQPTAARLARAALVALALLTAAAQAPSIATRVATPIDGLLPRSTADAASMARWLNARLHPRDVVLAMPQVSWLLDARTAELLQAVAITGRGSAFYPAGLAARRWVYDVHLRAARYLVVDAFTAAWIAQSAPERALVRAAARTWRLVYAHGEYRIYANPALDGR